MAHKFLRDDGWFQFPAPGDISVTSTATTTGFLGFITASMGSSANFTTAYVDGPSVSQGSSGTWYVSGTATFTSTAANTVIIAKLWDGTTTITAGSDSITVGGLSTHISLSGVVASPAGNLRISAFASASSAGFLASVAGQAGACNITAVRIG